MSRIGNKPIAIPNDVKVEIKESSVFVEGPKGKLSQGFSSRISIESKDGQVKVARKMDTKPDRSLHGLYRALIANMIKGVTQGYTKELEIIGVGFKAVVQGKNLTLQLGFSHPVVKPIPDGLTVETPKATQIVIKGIDKEKIGRFATEIRAVYPPEPYKGKGVRFAGEYVKKKVGKAQVAGGK
jgi:large subunit ribosomal protein L6